MPVIPCPNCRERMTVSPDDLGERVVCSHCEQVFTAQRELSRDARPVRNDNDDDFDRPKKKKRNTLLSVILALVGVFVVLPCLGGVGLLIYIGKAKQSFGDTWADYPLSSLQGGTPPVTASFPMPPISGPLAESANNGTGAVLAFNNMDHNDSLKDAIFLIGYVDYPAGTTNPLDRSYLAVRSVIAEEHLYNPLVMPRVVSEKPMTVGRYPAKEARYAHDDGDFTLRIIHVDDRPRGQPARLVVVLAGGTGMKEADKQKFLNSVRIGTGN